MLRHGAPAGVSIVLAAIVALFTNVFTDGWRWPAGVGLAIFLIALVTWEMWQASRRTAASGSRAIRTGSATAWGPASRANTGILGTPGGAAHHTGNAQAGDGGLANTGTMDGPSDEPPHHS
jgi:hypothetical protein